MHPPSRKTGQPSGALPRQWSPISSDRQRRIKYPTAAKKLQNAMNRPPKEEAARLFRKGDHTGSWLAEGEEILGVEGAGQ
jgi:hypothetical protein